jgi:hypothetical protein
MKNNSLRCDLFKTMKHITDKNIVIIPVTGEK